MRRTTLVFGGLALTALAVAGALALALRWYRVPLAGAAEGGIVEIAPGQTLAAIADGLAARRLLDHPRLWTLFARYTGQATRLRTGEYALRPGTTPEELLDLLVSGRVLLHPITLIEGWTFAEALAAVQGSPVVKPTLKGASAARTMELLGSAGVAPEGELFPDTYLVPRGATDLEVLKLAHVRLEQRLAAAWQERRPELPLASAYQALILASIVEKETGAPDERPRIAGVFVNRLRLGMRLQTDPSVIYGLGAAYDGSIHKRDLLADTPYNTYTRSGLPPTPIALPGAESLKAAVQPLATEELYFVATGRGDGRHVFSHTLAQHDAAVARYLAQLRGSAAHGTDR